MCDVNLLRFPRVNANDTRRGRSGRDIPIPNFFPRIAILEISFAWLSLRSCFRTHNIRPLTELFYEDSPKYRKRPIEKPDISLFGESSSFVIREKKEGLLKHLTECVYFINLSRIYLMIDSSLIPIIFREVTSIFWKRAMKYPESLKEHILYLESRKRVLYY